MLLSLLLLSCDAPSEELGHTADTSPPRGELLLSFPLLERDRFEQTVGVDHDPTAYEGVEQLICTNYDGRVFPWCYDEHGGTDYLLVGGFDAMDTGSATVIAPADGVVVEVEQSQYDRCHGDMSGEVDCDGHPVIANRVVLEHEGGWRTRALHLMKDSVVVEVGEEVGCGDPLALVGSSGNSSTPHLHLDLIDPEGERLDPYAGSHSQPETYWWEQGPPEGLPGDACP